MNYRYNVILLFALSFLSISYGFAQVSQKGLPRTLRPEYQKSNRRTVELPLFTMKVPSEDSIVAMLKKENEQSPKDRVGKVYGLGQPLNIDLLKKSVLEKTTAGTIYRYIITANNALGLQLYFEEFLLPKGGELYVYNKEHSMVLGAFTSENNTDGGDFLLQVIRGSTITVEYFEPIGTTSKALLKIKDAIYCFADIFGLDRSGDGKYTLNSSCNITCIEDVQCYFDNFNLDWKPVASSVGLVTTYDSGSGKSVACGTGTLMNNTNQDQKPYFLTALHIHKGWDYLKADHTQFIVYFNHQKQYCGQDPQEIDLNNSVSGLTKLVTNYDGDMALLLLNEQPPASYNVSFAGWSRTKGIGTFRGIHHPCGSLKKINTTFQIQESGYDYVAGKGDPVLGLNHWYVDWETGVTQGGSSGSPLFNGQKQVIGFLHGGASQCGIKDSEGRPDTDYYNKIDYSWSQLEPYLDPLNIRSGVLSILTPQYPNTCKNQKQDPGEKGVDCGGPCVPCTPTCKDGNQNGTETGKDCGGPCTPCANCKDGQMNGTETGIDCGGTCEPCATCNDKQQNQGESGIDCGGPCGPCARFCGDGRKNGDELYTDCGGSCAPCANVIPNSLSSNFEIGTACFDFGNYDSHKIYEHAFTLENDKCNIGWKAAYGQVDLYKDVPNNTVLRMVQESSTVTCELPNTNPKAYKSELVTRSSGVYYQLPFNLDPQKEYTLSFKMRQPPYNLGSSWSPTDFIEVAVTRGLSQMHTPVQPSAVPPMDDIIGYTKYFVCGTNYSEKYREYIYPAYTFEKQTLVATGGGARNVDWDIYEVKFTVESPDLNQLFIATYMNDASKVTDANIIDKYYHYSLLYFDDFYLQEKPRTSSQPFVHSSIIGPGGGGFFTGSQSPYLPGPNCFGNGNSSLESVFFGGMNGMMSVNVQKDISIYQAAVQKNDRYSRPKLSPQEARYYQDILTLNAGQHIDFSPSTNFPGGIDIAVGVNLYADIVPCSTFIGMHRKSDQQEQETTILEQKTFTIYPNPTTGVFNLFINVDVESKYTINVYNYMGQLVHQEESQTDEVVIDLSQLSQGVYIVKVIEEGQALMPAQKILISR